MKITIDDETAVVSVFDGPNERHYPFASAEAFAAVSRAWLRCGWDTKYVYGFSWLGRPVIQLPEDLMRIQELIYQLKPDVVIETGVAHGGSLIFYAHMCLALGKGRVIGIDIEIRPPNRAAIEQHELSRFIELVEGSSVDESTVAKVAARVAPDEVVLVILDSNHSKSHVSAELSRYSHMVSVGSYIVACDGIMRDLSGAPRANPDWTWNNPCSAVEDFLRLEFQLRTRRTQPTIQRGSSRGARDVLASSFSEAYRVNLTYPHRAFSLASANSSGIIGSVRLNLRAGVVGLVVATGMSGACSLAEDGLSDAESDGAIFVEAGNDAPCGACSDLISQGWQLVALGDASCPQNFTAETIALDPDAGDNACACACGAPNSASCSVGSATIDFGNGSCSTPATITFDGGCTSFVATGLPDHLAIIGPAPTSTACTPIATTNDAAVGIGGGILCTSPATCDETLCSGEPAGNLIACIAHSGDVACPSGAFQAKHTIGHTIDFACPTCACSPPTVTCANGVLSYFTNASCTPSALVAVTTTAGCQGNGFGSTLVSSLNFSAPVLDAGCAVVGDQDAAFSFTNERTICCR